PGVRPAGQAGVSWLARAAGRLWPARLVPAAALLQVDPPAAVLAARALALRAAVPLPSRGRQRARLCARVSDCQIGSSFCLAFRVPANLISRRSEIPSPDYWRRVQ